MKEDRTQKVENWSGETLDFEKALETRSAWIDCTAVTFNQAEKVNLGQEIVSGIKWLVINGHKRYNF